MNNEKKEYHPAEITFIEFDSADVIATSKYIEEDEGSWV